VINVEPHGPFTTNPEYLLDIVEHFESEYVQINFDTGNTYISGQDPLNFLKAVRKYVTHVHVKDVSKELAERRGVRVRAFPLRWYISVAASMLPISPNASAS